MDYAETLRDRFAMAALAGGLGQDATDDLVGKWYYGGDEIAERAYEIADAMIALKMKRR